MSLAGLSGRQGLDSDTQPVAWLLTGFISHLRKYLLIQDIQIISVLGPY